MSSLNLSELLAAAVGIALNPPAVIAVMLLLSSPRGLTKGAAFLAGWMAGVGAVAATVLVLGDVGSMFADPKLPALVLELLIGVGLVVGAVVKWRRGRAHEGDRDMPGWMRSLQEFSAGKAFTTAALFAALNPKTLAINVAGMLLIVEAELTASTQAALLVLFVVVASGTLAAPVVFYLVARDRSATVLSAAQRWLVNHSAEVTAAVLLVLGLLLASGAIEKMAALP